MLKAREHEAQERAKLKMAEEAKIAKFYESLQGESSEDLKDKLDDLSQYLCEFTGPATGVYIGKLECPRKPIAEDDDDKSHVDKEAPKIIRFHFTSKGHEFMKGKILKGDQGIVHSVFNASSDASAVEGEVEGEEGGENAEEGKAPKVALGDPNDILNTFKHLYVKEVVREPKIHFYKVPRLGAFMVVPLEYDSCLSAASLDKAVSDF